LLAPLAGRIYHQAPQQNAFPLGGKGERMKLLTLAVTCLPLLARAANAQASEWLLSSSRAGRITLGMTVDDLYNAYGRENVKLVDLFGEGMFTPALQVYIPSEPGAPIAVANIDQVCGQFRVSGFMVLSPLFKTTEGVGVGSTVPEVRKRYPAASLNREHRPSLIVDKIQLSFATTDGSFSDSTRVTVAWTAAPLPDSIRRCRQ
jgi:hypothetical protein